MIPLVPDAIGGTTNLSFVAFLTDRNFDSTPPEEDGWSRGQNPRAPRCDGFVVAAIVFICVARLNVAAIVAARPPDASAKTSRRESGIA